MEPGGAGADWMDAMTERASREREPRKGDFAQRAKSVVDAVTRSHEDPEEELDLTQLRDAAQARLEETLRQHNPHPNARRLIATRSAQEAWEARERALAAGEILDSGQAKDSSAYLRDRLSKEMGS